MASKLGEFNLELNTIINYKLIVHHFFAGYFWDSRPEEYGSMYIQESFAGGRIQS